MNKRLIRLILVSITVFGIGCSNTKYLLKGQKLYTGAVVKLTDTSRSLGKKDKKLIVEELLGLIRPRPNTKILGIRFKLAIYNRTQTKKLKGIRHSLHTRFAEPPVLASDAQLEMNTKIMTNHLQNKGYFDAFVRGDTVSQGLYAKAIYEAQVGPRSMIRAVYFPSGKNAVDTAVAGTSAQTLLKPGIAYNLETIKNERIRIDRRLKEEGFFYFSPENLLVQVDSTIKGHLIDLYVKVKDATPAQARQIFTIGHIYLYPNYTLRDTSLKLDSSVRYRWYALVDPKKTIRPYVFRNSVLLTPDMAYNRSDHTKSLNRMINLGPFKFVKNRFELDTAEKNKLDVFYFLTPYPKKSLQVELLGRTTSANYNGTQLNFSFRNRNTFRGAELLTLNLFASTDVQFGNSNKGFNVFQAGIQPSLSWPRFISPFDFKTNNAFIPRTILSGGFTLVNRSQLYTLHAFNASFGYQWKSNLHKQHDLNLLAINYVNAAGVTQLYKDSLNRTRNPSLAHVIDRQFTFGPSYGYTYSNTTEENRMNSIYYQGRISFSAALTGLITGADTLRGKVKTLFGTPFNQFVKLENELRYYHQLGPKSRLATRVIGSFGLPYGNSTILPYSQQFFIGGANSLRGFQARSLGPGSYRSSQSQSSSNNFLPDESGDIKLEANVEYRPKLFSIVEGALFMDMGNIWLFRKNALEPGAEFGKNFLGQLAADVGLGLRFNLSVLVLRTDMGFPVLEPSRPQGQQWLLKEINFSSPSWRRQNLVFNLAIGYPF